MSNSLYHFDLVLVMCGNKKNLPELSVKIRLPFIPRVDERMLDIHTICNSIPEPYGDVMWSVWSVDYRHDKVGYIPYVWLEDIEL